LTEIGLHTPASHYNVIDPCLVSAGRSSPHRYFARPC